MTTYFETAPNYCPDCRHKLDVSNAVGGFIGGNICNCSACGFEYAKAPEPQMCEVGHDSRYQYSSDGRIRCTACDLKTSWDKIASLEATIETDKAMFDHLTAKLRAEVVEMIRDEARAAVIEAFNMPIGDIVRICASAEQMDADRVGTGGSVDVTYLGKADPFIAID